MPNISRSKIFGKFVLIVIAKNQNFVFAQPSFALFAHKYDKDKQNKTITDN